MKLPNNVKVKSGLWRMFPFSRYTAQAIYPNIYLIEKVYNNLVSDSPKPRYKSVLIHEQTHIDRQKRFGWFKWGLKYLIIPSFRFNEELVAIQNSMTYLKGEGLSFDTTKRAKYLSSWLYLWCVSYKEAKRELDRAWEEA